MIIDTDTPEGRALVALAKFGHSILIDAGGKYVTNHSADFQRFMNKAVGFGLIELTSKSSQPGAWKEIVSLTNLAKLPEGI